MFFSSSRQNHAESFRNLIKKSVLDPKCANLDQKSEHGGTAFGISQAEAGDRSIVTQEHSIRGMSIGEDHSRIGACYPPSRSQGRGGGKEADGEGEGRR